MLHSVRTSKDKPRGQQRNSSFGIRSFCIQDKHVKTLAPKSPRARARQRQRACVCVGDDGRAHGVVCMGRFGCEAVSRFEMGAKLEGREGKQAESGENERSFTRSETSKKG